MKKVGGSLHERIGRVATGSWPGAVSLGVAGWMEGSVVNDV